MCVLFVVVVVVVCTCVSLFYPLDQVCFAVVVLSKPAERCKDFPVSLPTFSCELKEANIYW